MSSTSHNGDFAHLFELFEKLASGRSRATDFTEPSLTHDTSTLSIPKDLQPVFRNLASLVTPRTATTGSTRRGRRNTVAVPSGSSDVETDTDTESVAQFPIGKQYPFKFKMMLHKLYEIEEWGKKVKEVLEMSQKKFKPLTETEGDRLKGGEKERKDVGSRVDVGLRSPPGRTGRPRSNTVGAGRDNVPRAPVSTLRVEPRDDERAVKKRCVGRRKSISSGMAGESSGWVFNATVASSEINERVDTPAPATVARYGALQQEGRRRAPPRRRVSSVASVTPAVDVRETVDDRKFKKRRATSVAVVKRS
ncbi:hypothetical protein EV361DRAFT_867161 [Lentinula raphanica]|uniref:Uncharacterized protein n=1 Tax=Lentinula raphanica TaxID=153919 RepID=A0AA38P6A0_9AGAR|nr:hypothetical protein F5880DRAFT_1487071 [Lentinula raphanica]KAJ3837094.1 hypothetical protein F5878DRAFT_662400 [Lentinula raphanica]KAJ3973126.1 hypothetical protein EV361DRAFT_867161 [Lentinula raphanica]